MQDRTIDKTCIVVGAGMAGLLAARTIEQAGIRTTVFEEGRAVGGRMSTSRLEDGVFDDGAQFFTLRDDSFAALVDQWVQEGVVAEWSRGFARPDGSYNEDGHPRYYAVGGMAAVPAHIARGLDVRTGARVAAIQESGSRWEVVIDGGTVESADAVIMTPPAEQSLAVVDAGDVRLAPSARATLEKIRYAPCISVMLVLEGPSGVPEPGAVQLSGQNGAGEPVWWLADNRRKGISPSAHAITIHGGPEFSAAHWDQTDDDVVSVLIEIAHHFIRSRVRSVRTRRWQYSQPIEPHSESCLVAVETPPLVFAGDAFGGAKVEGAALSGLAAAEQVRRLLRISCECFRGPVG